MRGNAKTAADPGPFSGQKLRNTGDGRPPFARIALQRYVSRTMLMFRQIFDPHLSLSLSRHPAIHAFLFHLRKCTGDKNVQGCIFGGILTLPWPPTLRRRIYIFTHVYVFVIGPLFSFCSKIFDQRNTRNALKTRPIIDFRGITGEMKFIEIKISSSSPLDSHFSSYDFLSSIKNKIVIADRLRTTTTTTTSTTTTTTTILFGFV